MLIKYFLCISIFIIKSQTQTPIPEKTLDDIINEFQSQNNAADFDFSETPTTKSSTDVTDDIQTVPCFNGVCVEPYLCTENKTLNYYGSFLVDDRSKQTQKTDCHYLQVCCNTDNVVDKDHQINPGSVKRNGCGNRYVNGTGITNTGNKDLYSQFGEFPWMVAIIEKEDLFGKTFIIYKCGGSLIHPKIILTAAHCVKNYTNNFGNIIIRAGEWDTRTTNEPYPSVERFINRIIIHQNYYAPASLNDIALIEVKEPFQIVENIQTICLPPVNYNFDYNQCITSGWGKDKFGKEGQYQNILKKVELPVVPNLQCQSKLRTTRLSHRFILHESFICAGGQPGVDVCTGDGGSPLVCPIPNTIDRYYQAGIVAWGVGCFRPIPGVYVDVAKFKPWIDENMDYLSLEKSFYTP